MGTVIRASVEDDYATLLANFMAREDPSYAAFTSAWIDLKFEAVGCSAVTADAEFHPRRTLVRCETRSFTLMPSQCRCGCVQVHVGGRVKKQAAGTDEKKVVSSSFAPVLYGNHASIPALAPASRCCCKSYSSAASFG